MLPYAHQHQPMVQLMIRLGPPVTACKEPRDHPVSIDYELLPPAVSSELSDLCQCELQARSSTSSSYSHHLPSAWDNHGPYDQYSKLDIFNCDSLKTVTSEMQVRFKSAYETCWCSHRRMFTSSADGTALTSVGHTEWQAAAVSNVKKMVCWPLCLFVQETENWLIFLFNFWHTLLSDVGQLDLQNTMMYFGPPDLLCHKHNHLPIRHQLQLLEAATRSIFVNIVMIKFFSTKDKFFVACGRSWPPYLLTSPYHSNSVILLIIFVSYISVNQHCCRLS